MLKCWYWLKPSRSVNHAHRVLHYGTPHRHLVHHVARYAAAVLVCTIVGGTAIGTGIAEFSSQDDLPTFDRPEAKPIKVPEPASATVFAIGLIGFLWLRRKGN